MKKAHQRRLDETEKRRIRWPEKCIKNLHHMIVTYILSNSDSVMEVKCWGNNMSLYFWTFI